MRLHRLGILAVTGLLLPGPQASDGAQSPPLPMPCLQLVNDQAVRAAIGDGFTLDAASSPRRGESQCVWSDARATPMRRLGVSFVDTRGFPDATPTAKAAYQARAAALTRAGLTPEPIDGLGTPATRFASPAMTVVLAQRADGVVSVSAIDLTFDQAIAVARRALAAPSPVLGAHATVPEPVPVEPATPMVLAPEMRAWPCVRALSAADVRAQQRQDVLVDVIRPRPGYSACQWRQTTADGTGFRLAVATDAEFADAGAADAAAFFALERKLLEPLEVQPVPGLGDEAVVGSPDRPIILVRTPAAVLTFNCDDCSRDQAIALARLATAKLPVPVASRPTPPRPAPSAALPLPCLQLVDERAIKAALGDGFTPTATSAIVGESSCLWWDERATPARIVQVAFTDRRALVDRLFYPDVIPTAAALYDTLTSAFAAAGAKADPIAGVGERAAAITLTTSTEVMVQRPDGVARVHGDLPRPQLVALARAAAAAPAPTLGRHVDTPDLIPYAEVGAMDLTPESRSRPCVQTLTAAEVASLRRPEVLVDAQDIRPGFSWCEWRSSTDKQTGFVVVVRSGQEFAERRVANAAALMAAERKGLQAAFRPEPVAGLGDEALVTQVAPTQVLVLVRRGTQVLSVNCFDCSRDEALGLARLAAR